MVLDALPSPLEFPIGIGNKPSPHRYSVSRLSIRSRSLALSLLRHHILTLTFASLFTARGIAWSAPEAGDQLRPLQRRRSLLPAWSQVRQTTVRRRFLRMAIRSLLLEVPRTGLRSSSRIKTMENGHTQHWRPSQANGPTRPRRCRPMEPILYSNPSAPSFHWRRTRRKENPFPASCPTFGA
jgi:hypothetical protein